MTFMVGHKFPEVNLSAVLQDGSIKEDFKVQDYAKGQYSVVFFYPLDFTFVCPTELVAFDKAMAKFEQMGVKVMGASVDSVHAHAAWRRTPLNEGGIGDINYPLISDLNKELSSELGILTGGVTFRASYLMDKEGTVRHMVINDLPLGRNVSEMVRMVEALQFHEEHGEVCPANWKQGEEAMSADRESTAAYLAKNA